MTIRWEAAEKYFNVVVVFQFFLVCNFGKMIILDFALSKVKALIHSLDRIQMCYSLVSIPTSVLSHNLPTSNRKS